MSDLPLVTIAIPTWNRGRYLSEAIDSVLTQTYPHIEVVVSDNASTDDTPERLTRISDPRVRFSRNPENLGAVVNLNLCLQQAQGELFLLLSDDDLLEPTAIKRLSEPLRTGVPGAAAETIGLTWCPYLNLAPDRTPRYATEAGPALESSVDLIVGLFNGRRGPQLSSVMVRTADARRVGGYDGVRHVVLCDTGNWGKVALHYSHVVCIPEPLVRYTVMTSSAVSNSTVKDWQTWGSSMHEDLVAVVRDKGDLAGEIRLTRLKNRLLANLTATVLMRGLGRPGWISTSLKELWKGRSFMLTPFVAKRILRDGWKLLRG